MSRCQCCGGARILARCSDMCSVDLAGQHEHGYLPGDLGLGGGDHLHFAYCLDCGQVQGGFSVPPHSDGGRSRD